ncbi:MAG: DUF881 domain-containing protein [Bacillota bacterium]|nr:DUF881 domain-containing protein [Bacillota bacterium]
MIRLPRLPDSIRVSLGRLLDRVRSRHAWFESPRGAHQVLVATLALVLLIVFVSAVGRSEQERRQISVAVDELSGLQSLIAEQQERNLRLEQEAVELGRQRDELVTRLLEESAFAGAEGQKALEDLALNRRLAQATAVTGPGIRLVMGDASGVEQGSGRSEDLIHERDIQDAINLLKSAGATAIAVNNERLISSSKLICNGPTILVNRNLQAAPFVITATGEPERLLAALEANERLLYLQLRGKEIHYHTADDLVIPAFRDETYIRTVTDLMVERSQP